MPVDSSDTEDSISPLFEDDDFFIPHQPDKEDSEQKLAENYTFVYVLPVGHSHPNNYIPPLFEDEDDLYDPHRQDSEPDEPAAAPLLPSVTPNP